MKLVKNYIVEVHSVEVVTQDHSDYVLVDVTVDSCGHVNRKEIVCLSIDEWEAVRVLGYFTAWFSRQGGKND